VAFFETLSSATMVSAKVVGFYLPPSVRRQMMGEEPLGDAEETDLGSVVASHVDVKDIIVNALFALPPFITCSGRIRKWTDGGRVSVLQPGRVSGRTATDHRTPFKLKRNH
jgi:hypothetical protein